MNKYSDSKRKLMVRIMAIALAVLMVSSVVLSIVSALI